MPKIEINIDEQVKNHFDQFVEKKGAAIDASHIEEARQKIREIRRGINDAYVVDQVNSLDMMLSMIEDKTWEVSAENRDRITATIKYFCDDEDLIPDSIPGIGYIDDCIIIDGAAEQAFEEMDEFKDFSKARAVYAKGEEFSLEDWDKIKNQELGSRLRNRRLRRSRSRYGKDSLPL